MKKKPEDYSHIKGWGIDADPENEPTYPIKKYTGDDHQRLSYAKPPQQPSKVEILHSNERPGLTSVFGTSSPPSGLSGLIRRHAFTYSEGNWGHWLSLILADRINVWEGIASDLLHGHIPNIFAERGWNAELKYNKKGAIQKVVTGVLVATVAAGLLYGLTRKKKKTHWL
ncbi:hypothetical protein QNI19_09545 [Cytophagaceae bacterium DM2B3-1]|uniref:Uncharacterized protein n=1 Tax=Xanthocytophaga flava TaxID=3048013 RepID=A0ABT7CHF0_9BACT|nr:hypothetical protein [Xanthocytophaga flavus]MDJ1470774.1 hypothetical protein [Xanthocytophaga flavus]MDJ1493173.1 hypothetical protein [Xanthocytophaga flavus]